MPSPHATDPRAARLERIARVKFVGLPPEAGGEGGPGLARALRGVREWVLRAIGGLVAARP